MSDSVTILMPCLNEIEGLSKILPQIKKEWYDQILVLDGWSKDGSREWCEKNGYEVLMRSQPKTGIWKAYMEAFKSGRIRGNVIVTFSPDGNSMPESIPMLTDKIKEGYDLVIGSRYLSGIVSCPDDTTLTTIGNKIFTGLCNLAKFGAHYTDALVMLRAYRIEIIEKLGLLKEPTRLQRKLISMSPLYSFEPSMAIRAIKADLNVAEIPVIEPRAFRERRQNTFNHGFVIGTQILSEVLFDYRGKPS